MRGGAEGSDWDGERLRSTAVSREDWARRAAMMALERAKTNRGLRRQLAERRRARGRRVRIHERRRRATQSSRMRSVFAMPAKRVCRGMPLPFSALNLPKSNASMEIGATERERERGGGFEEAEEEEKCVCRCFS